MRTDYTVAYHTRLEPATRCVQPPELPLTVTLDSPAKDVMTDFSYVRPVTTHADIGIDDALRRMKDQGVRLLLVCDAVGEVIGLITSNDIQGEKPIKLIQETRVARHDISVAQIMTPQANINTIHMVSVLGARVGHIVATLRELEHRHLLVVQHGEEIDDTLPEGEGAAHFAVHEWSAPRQTRRELPTGELWIRGLFAASQIGRQLGVEISDIMGPAHSLAEVLRDSA